MRITSRESTQDNISFLNVVLSTFSACDPHVKTVRRNWLLSACAITRGSKKICDMVSAMMSATTSATMSAMASATISAMVSATTSATMSATTTSAMMSATISDCGGLHLSASVVLKLIKFHDIILRIAKQEIAHDKNYDIISLTIFVSYFTCTSIHRK